MSDQEKKLTREELYEHLWQTPMSKLATNWGVPIHAIVKAAAEMNVPRPESGHWQRIKLGWQVERDALPAAEATTPAMTIIKAAEKRFRTPPGEAPAPSEGSVPAKPRWEIPKNLDNAHLLVKRTHKALTHDTYLDKGLVHARTRDMPLAVEVSREQVGRALRIMDVIVKAMIERGGKFKQETGKWHLELFMGKQPVWFRITERRKRSLLDIDDEERKERGLMSWEKHDWKGAGVLRFEISGDKYVNGRLWEENKRVSLESFLPEIIGSLERVEKDGEENRAREAEQQKLEAEEQRKQNLEWRRKHEEDERRKLLEQAGEQWQRAHRVREFIRACESEIQKQAGNVPPESRAAQWLAWAREYADQIDPLTHGYLVNLIKSVRDMTIPAPPESA